MDDPRLRRQFGKGEARRRCGEVEDALCLGEERQRIVADRKAVGAEPGQLARIAAKLRNSGPFAARVTPGVSAMTRISVRPIRPAAPVTISPISLMAGRSSSRLYSRPPPQR
jgi:hypothetical protein